MLEHVLDPVEPGDPPGHLLAARAEETPDRSRRKQVSGQVNPRHLQVVEVEQTLFSTVPPDPGGTFAEKGPVAFGKRLTCDAQQQQARARATALREHHGVVRIHHCPVGCLLPVKDPRLRRDVRVERGVPIEVVGREVEPDRHLGMEAGGALELEA